MLNIANITTRYWTRHLLLDRNVIVAIKPTIQPAISTPSPQYRNHGTSSQHSAEATFASSPPTTTTPFGTKPISSPLIKPAVQSQHYARNIVLRYCGSSPVKQSALSPLTSGVTSAVALESTSPRPLILLFAWMLARDDHIEKYRQFWFDRGYDVLSIRTSPMSLLLPGVGGRQNAVSIYNILANHRPLYDRIVVHAFSVGGYQLCELLNVLEEEASGPHQASTRQLIYSSIKAFIIDSCVYPEDASPGLSRAVTKHPIIQPALEKCIDAFLTFTKPFTLDRYRRVETKLFANRKRIPGLMLYSKDDLVSNYRNNEKMLQGWKDMGIVTDHICWDESVHVLHFKQHHQQYRDKVDQFLASVHNLSHNNA